jgi:Cft2 family RNA processing exonuclease
LATLTFWGAAGTVTGSKYLIETEHARVLVDCGLFQGPRVLRDRNWAEAPFPAASVDAVLTVRCHTERIGGFSAHADWQEVIRWLQDLPAPPRGVFVTHGELESATAMAQHIRERFNWAVEVPEHGQQFELA